MFLHFFKDDFADIFQDGRYPKLSRFSNSHRIPGWSINLHLHREDTEIVYVDQGEAVYSIERGLQAGEILVIERGKLHSLDVPESAGNAWTCTLRGFKIKGLEEGRVLRDGAHPVKSAGEQDDFFRQAMGCLAHLRRFDDPVFRQSCNFLAAAVVSLTHELFKSAGQDEQAESSSFAKETMAWLDENYTRPITLKELADIFHVSQSHLSHEFARAYRISPINYVIERRLDAAKWLLINTGEPLVSVARQVGYDNTSHFANLFKSRLDCAPLEFRAKFGGGA